MNAEITYPLNLLLLFIGAFLGIRLTLFLLVRQSFKANSNKYLSPIIFCLSLSFIVGIFYRFDVLQYVAHLIGFEHFMFLLIGPLTYLYVLSCTQKEFILKPILWFHFAPFLIDILMNISFFTSTSEVKLDYYSDFVTNGTLILKAQKVPIRMIHAIVYFALSLRIVSQYRKHLNDATSNIDKTFHRWLLFFVFMVAFPLFGLISLGFGDYDRSVSLTFILFGYAAFFVAIDIAILLKPELFHDFPHQALIPSSSEVKKQKYESSKLEEDKKEKYLRQLEVYITQHEPYKKSELTLKDLSNRVEIPSHYLSQVINEKLGTNFMDFINKYRVETAKSLLNDPSLNHYTIMSIAYDSGFNSKSTFYAAFKKHTGITPSQYRDKEGILV